MCLAQIVHVSLNTFTRHSERTRERRGLNRKHTYCRVRTRAENCEGVQEKTRCAGKMLSKISKINVDVTQ